jgi:putative lipoic acid-binding regulatory protein
MSSDIPENEPLLQFPCSFPIKTMGRDQPGFRDNVVAIVEKHAGSVDEDSIRSSPSRNGNFVSITITIQAQSQDQLDSIYQELTAHDDVLFSL